MSNAVLVALIGLAGSGLGSVLGILVSSKLTQYRLEQLEKKVEVHNKVIDQVYNLYSPVVYSVGDILDTYTYRQGIVKSNYSYATAAGLFQNVIGFILVIASNVTVKRLSDGEEGLW